MAGTRFSFPAGWSLTGNVNTDPTKNYFGTSDNVDVIFKRNNTNSGIISDTNTGFGQYTVSYGISGTQNTHFGFANGSKLTSGNDNASFGAQAGNENKTGSSNVFFGKSAGRNNVAGNFGIYIGSNAGETQLAGNKNLVVGYNGQLPNKTNGGQLNISNAIWGINCTGEGTIPNGQISIGANAPHSSAAFDVYGTLKGLGYPIMTTAEINSIVSPKLGLLVFNSDLDCPCFYSAAGWRKISHSAM